MPEAPLTPQEQAELAKYKAEDGEAPLTAEEQAELDGYNKAPTSVFDKLQANTDSLISKAHSSGLSKLHEADKAAYSPDGIQKMANNAALGQGIMSVPGLVKSGVSAVKSIPQYAGAAQKVLSNPAVQETVGSIPFGGSTAANQMKLLSRLLGKVAPAETAAAPEVASGARNIATAGMDESVALHPPSPGITKPVNTELSEVLSKANPNQAVYLEAPSPGITRPVNQELMDALKPAPKIELEAMPPGPERFRQPMVRPDPVPRPDPLANALNSAKPRPWSPGEASEAEMERLADATQSGFRRANVAPPEPALETAPWLKEAPAQATPIAAPVNTPNIPPQTAPVAAPVAPATPVAAPAANPLAAAMKSKGPSQADRDIGSALRELGLGDFESNPSLWQELIKKSR